ncbi:MAG TPA: hypothetical protein ENK18_02210 [Deltaproteobacteria bacterium]|nr:hypothetical protein [Deltaproteobacteria bacterium]
MLLSCVLLSLIHAFGAFGAPATSPGAPPGAPPAATAPGELCASDFLALLQPNPRRRRAALRRITADFEPSRVPMALEILRFQTQQEVVDQLWRWLVAGTGVELADREAAYEWLMGRDGALPRVPAHRAFWFGWHAAWPETRLAR